MKHSPRTYAKLCKALEDSTSLITSRDFEVIPPATLIRLTYKATQFHTFLQTTLRRFKRNTQARRTHISVS